MQFYDRWNNYEAFKDIINALIDQKLQKLKK